MIQGIFYARFLPQEGTKVLAQSPPGCIVPVEGVPKPPLFDFETLQNYIIPKPSFFNRYVTVTDPDGKYCILGHPVSIRDPKYRRNEFIFNFGLVVEACIGDDPDPSVNGSGHEGYGGSEGKLVYERVVRRLAQTFAEMEMQGKYLSEEERACVGGGAMGARRPIESLLEIIKEDLNNYGECMIPVDEATTLNMKLFPHHPVPAPVHGWHVPVAKTKLTSLLDPTWDLTLQRIITHIDGVSDVRRIAFNADVSLDLCQSALQHLLRYDTILLLDMFFFSNCYAPRPAGIHDFIANRDNIVEECAEYCCIGPGTLTPSPPASRLPSGAANLGVRTGLPVMSSSPMASRSPAPTGGLSLGTAEPMKRLPNYILIKLMTTFCVGRSVMEWLKSHVDNGFDVLRFLDVRRFVQFGLIKGILYRVHKYVVSKQYIAGLATGLAYPIAHSSSSNGRKKDTPVVTVVNSSTVSEETAAEASGVEGSGSMDGAARKGSRKGRGSDAGQESTTAKTATGKAMREGDPLQKYMDGCHCFDQIITEQNLTDGEIMEKLKSFNRPHGDLVVFYR